MINYNIKEIKFKELTMLATETKQNTTPEFKDVPFNFDLTEMEKVVVEAPETAPTFKNFDDFDKWVDSL